MDNNLEKIYNFILNDKEIKQIYKTIEKETEKNKGWANHDFKHIKNVIELEDKILKDLNYDEEIIYKAKIAGILHDVGTIKGKENHAERSYKFSKEYFEKNKINFNGIEKVLDAIKNHSEGFETNNIITLTLIFADKLDIKHTRVTKDGKYVIGMRQYRHIKDINIEIKEKNLIINFIADKKINMKEFLNYYFTKKTFKAIISFSNKLNLKHKILINNIEIKEACNIK